MANSVDPDQTIGAVCSGSTQFASIVNSSVMPVCSGSMQFASIVNSSVMIGIFFLGALRVKQHITFSFPIFAEKHLFKYSKCYAANF